MTFEEILDQAIAMLQRRGRVSYRTLTLQFHLDEASLEALKEELIEVHHLAVDHEGRMLVWAGEARTTSVAPSPQPPQQGIRQEDHPAQVAPPATPRSADAERRQLTVMFCDLVDSTVLAGQLDPEDLREVLRAYQAACATVIERLEGHIAQYLGDGLLVYFGYPQAHEDDAQRAVRAGLGIVGALHPLNTHLAQRHGVRVAVRLGIHTGLVVVGEVGSGSRQEQLALGETPNLAARLQGLAAPDTMVISAATFRLVQGYFTAEPLGVHTLRGIAAPVPLYRILGESGVQSRLDVVTPRGLTPLVGRDEEVALLRRRWEQASMGMGQVVLLSGEAGIGKSRLVQVLKDHVAAEPHTRIEWRGSSSHQLSALYPVIAHLHRLLRWHHDDPPSKKLRMLEATLAASGLTLLEAVPLLAALLSLPVPTSYLPLALTPQRQRQQTLDLLLVWLHTEARRQPVLCVVEDLHWVDPSTLELLSLLIDQSAQARLCLVLTTRPEFPPPWTMVAHLTTLTLRRFAPAQVERVARHVAGDKALPSAVLQEVVRKTDGVPLFVEELTKTVLESGLLEEREDHYALHGPLPSLAIPATLHDALLARLDRLAAAKVVAQLGATIGRTFTYEVVQAVAPLDAATLQGALVQLMEAEVVTQRGLPPQATYTFKHALIQDAAYESLLRSTRQQYHQRLAQILTERFPDTAETQPELLAHHYTEAGLAAEAVGYWQRAGAHSTARSAYAEAAAHCTRGLEVLQTLPDTPTRVQQELPLLLTLAGALRVIKGYAAPEVGQVFSRARVLCQHAGDTPELFDILLGLGGVYYQNRGELQTALALVEQALTLAQRLHDPVLLIRAHGQLGVNFYHLGEPAPARTHQDQALTLPGAQLERPLIVFRQDPRVLPLAYAAVTLWTLGYPDQALTRSHELLTLVQGLADPFSMARTLLYATELHLLRREWAIAQARAEAGLALSTERGFEQWVGGLTFQRGQVLAAQGQYEEGIAQMRLGLAAKQAAGTELGRPRDLAHIAEAYSSSGQTEAGMQLLDEARAWMIKHGEDFTAASVYRIQGEVLLRHVVPDVTQAEACFQQALTVAHRQQAKALELRAAMSLARLWQQQGQRAEAYELLAPIYNWFTEGFDTADLQDAKTLLEALA
jgi:class 3 adenylate cyclase/predicted ATPase